MSNDSADGGADALTVLELLARQAPPGRFAELLDQARVAGRPEHELAALERAVHLATGVSCSLARREQREEGLAALLDTTRDLTLPYDLDGLLRVITRRAKRLLGLDLACVTLRGPHGGRLLHSAEGALTALDPAGCPTLFEGDGLGGLVHALGEPAWTEDYLDDARFAHSAAIDELVRAEGLRGVLAVPLRTGETTLGVLYGADRSTRRYTADEIALVAALADLAAVATEKAGLLDQTRAEVTELERDSSRARTRLTRMRYIGEAHSRIMNLILAGGDLRNVATAAGDALDGAVLVRDPGGRTLAQAGELPGLDEDAVAKASLDAHAGRRPVLTTRGAGSAGERGHEDDGGDQTWVAPVLAGSEDLGVLVVRAATPLTGEDERLLELAAQSVAFLLLMQRSTAVAEGPVRDELLDDLLAEPQHSPQQIAQRARRLGLDLRKPHVVVVARPEGGEQGRAVVWASSYAYRMSGLKTVHGGAIVLLLPGVDASAAAKAVSGELSPLLGHPVSVGAAGPGWSPDSVSRLYLEAMRCLDAMGALGGSGAAASVQDLGFLGLLLSDDHDVDGFIESAIGPVLDYDAERFTDLTRTLEAYFASGGSPTNAAEALHVHPNTVSRRLERIGELLGAEWQKPGHVLEVQLALRLQRTRDVLARQRADLRDARTTGTTASQSCERPGT
ncbi:helix-turn-helix domain-containing protein [Streptomyces showdoensis]|uniref:Transcriptional regulator n=1 Tax=Streptomyces showdoensis TaxID=68268 RepID=A0A2P2GRG5_STREW|nr:helix-turn-helix domain-containing protein [Streptomyces showdoensis]KKZ74086.1 transcriptional regulator [Streptomyces showdoensis]